MRRKICKKTYFLMAALSALVLPPMAACGDTNKHNAASNGNVKAVSKSSSILKYEDDFDKAYQEAKKDGKKLVLEFTGSTWCPPCMMLHKFVLNTEKFAKYAKEKLHFVMADFARDGQPTNKKFANKNTELAQKYNLGGFPTIVIINPKTDKFQMIEGFRTQTPEALIEVIESFKD